MKWKFLAGLCVTFIALGTVASIVLAQWTDTQNTTGAVNVTTESAELYICETGGADCAVDDSGADEIIFEGVEDLYPGSTATYDFRLRNIGTLSWDVTSVTHGFTETSDPGTDCNDEPTVYFTVIDCNGNHFYGCTTSANPPPLPRFRKDDLGGCGCTIVPTAEYWQGNVHVEPGENEDMRAYVTLPSNAAVECQDNVWDLSVDWEVTPH